MKNILSKSIKALSLQDSNNKITPLNKVLIFKIPLYMEAIPVISYQEINESYKNIMNYYKKYKPYTFLERYNANNSRCLYNLGFGYNNLIPSLFERSNGIDDDI